MIQKIIAITLFLFGIYIFSEAQSFYTAIPIMLGIGLFNGSLQGTLISFGAPGTGDSSDSSGDGGGD